MAWRLAYSLETLRTQVNVAYPNRSTASDGTIGDAAHAGTASDHNPNSAGVVCALDLTHDPAHGLDVHALADKLRVNRHPNLKYIISNRRITGPWNGWNWEYYGGSNPHDKHAHFSVGVGSDGKSMPGTYDDTTKWSIGKEIDLVNDDICKYAYGAWLGREPNSAELASWRGRETNLLILSLVQSKEANEYYVKVKAALAGGGTFKPYSGPALFVK